MGIKGKPTDRPGGDEQLALRAQAARISDIPPDIISFTVTGVMADFANLKDVVNGLLEGATISLKKGSAFNRHPRAHTINLIANDTTNFKLSGPKGDSDEIELPLVGPTFEWEAFEAEAILFKTEVAGPTRIQVTLG